MLQWIFKFPPVLLLTIVLCFNLLAPRALAQEGDDSEESPTPTEEVTPTPEEATPTPVAAADDSSDKDKVLGGTDSLGETGDWSRHLVWIVPGLTAIIVLLGTNKIFKDTNQDENHDY